MICCVIGGALAALFIARLSKIPGVGAYFKRMDRRGEDPSHWRLRVEEKQS